MPQSRMGKFGNERSGGDLCEEISVARPMVRDTLTSQGSTDTKQDSSTNQLGLGVAKTSQKSTSKHEDGSEVLKQSALDLPHTSRGGSFGRIGQRARQL